MRYPIVRSNSRLSFASQERILPCSAKHSKHFSLEDSLAVGVDRMQRNFGPLKQQVEEWQALQLSTASAKLLIYQAFIEEIFFRCSRINLGEGNLTIPIACPKSCVCGQASSATPASTISSTCGDRFRGVIGQGTTCQDGT